MVLLFLLCSGALEPKVKVTFEAVPDDSDFYLEQPMSADFDSAGNLYLIDAGAGVIFKWKADGSFEKTIGQPGQGPGEFQFSGGRGPGIGLLSVANDKLYVIDRRRTIQLFDLDGNYKETVDVEVRNGGVMGFAATQDGSFIIQQRQFMAETPSHKLMTIKPGSGDPKVIADFADTSFKRDGERGRRPRSVTLTAFSPRLVFAFDKSSNAIVYGFGDQPKVSLMTLGQAEQKLELGMNQPDVTAADKEEFSSQSFIANNNFFKAEFPEKKAYFDKIALVGEQILVYRESPVFHNVEGLLIDKKGTDLGSVTIKCGEGGTLLNNNNRLVCVSTDDDGDFAIEELNF